VHGVAPFGYHLVNFALHAAVCVVLALVLARIAGDATLALLAAFLFAAHPVHTEAVASVVGRAELLAALLGLLAWWIVVARRSVPARAAVLVTLLPANPTMRVGVVTFLHAVGREQEARSAQAAAERLFPRDAGVRQMRQLLGG